MRRALQLIGCGLGCAWLLALGCDSTPARSPDVDGYRSLPPASSQQRAEARAQRAARRQALEDQGVRSPAPKQSAAPQPLPAPPPPAPEVSASAAPEEIADAGPIADAATDAIAVDAGLTNAELCAGLCKRVMSCALEMLKKTAGNLDPSLLDRMKDNMRDGQQECLDRCSDKTDEASDEELATAHKCLADPDCEAFMDCIRDLMK